MNETTKFLLISTFTFLVESCSRPSSGGCCRTGQKPPPRTGSSCHPQPVLWKLKHFDPKNSCPPPLSSFSPQAPPRLVFTSLLLSKKGRGNLHPSCLLICSPPPVLLPLDQGLTGSRYPTRPDLFFNYPTHPVPIFENDRVACNQYFMLTAIWCSIG